MNSFIKIFICLILLNLTNIFSIAQVNVHHVQPGAQKPVGKGVFYSLPRTFLKIDVTVKALQNLKGPLSDFAEKYFGIEDAITYDFTTYEIGDIFISAFNEPDPEQIYFVEITERTIKEPLPFSLSLSESGYISGFNTSGLELKSEELKEKQVYIIEREKNISSSLYEFFINGKLKPKTDTIIRKITVDTISLEQKFFRTSFIEKLPEEIAKNIVAKIENIRESKLKLLTGFQEVAYEKQTIEYMNEQLDKMENDYFDLFRGKSYAEILTYTFYFLPPTGNDDIEEPLFKFSKNTGINPIRGASGDNVLIKIKAAGCSVSMNDFFPSGEEMSPGSNGFYYRIPEVAEISLILENEELAYSREIINQLGSVRCLPPEKIKVEFETETGGIKSLMIK